MPKVILCVLIASILSVSAGCRSADTGTSQIVPQEARQAQVEFVVPDSAEADIIERMTAHRQAYRAAIESLADYYDNTGNHMKLNWAKAELAALDDMPQYNYIIEAVVAGEQLSTSHSIPLADYMYADARQTEKKARRLILVKDKELLRWSLDRYNQLIRQHPSSDKIDDAAYRAGRICETLKDYSIAVLYYQRCYQWDRNSPHPARYRQARILDRKLHRRSEALELYRQSLQLENLKGRTRSSVQQRIDELTMADAELED
jgi:hypothetical protein